MTKKLQDFFLKNGGEGLARNAEHMHEYAYQTSVKSKTHFSITDRFCFPTIDIHHYSFSFYSVTPVIT